MKIPIRIKNVENPSGNGTVIYPNASGGDTPESSQPPIPAVTTLQNLSLYSINGPSTHRLPTAVTIKEGIIVLNINSNRKSVSHGFLARIFATLDKFGVVVDLISTSEVHVSMAVEKSLGKKALDRLVADLQRLGTVSRYSSNTIGCCVMLRRKTAHRPSRDGHPLVGGQANAKHGWYCRKDVLDTCRRKCQH